MTMRDATVMTDSGDSGGLMETRPAPTNVSFESAKRIEPDGMPVLQDQVAVEQRDYFVFSGKQGEYYEIRTDDQSFSPDVVLTLYDADQTLLASNDFGTVWPGDRVDARLVVRLPADGDYYIEIDDPYTPAAFFRSSFPLLFYHLELRSLHEGMAGVAIAQGSDPAAVEFAHDERTGYAYVTLLGELGADPSSFELTGGAAQALIGHVLPSGTTGNGSTAAGGSFDVVDGEQHVLAHIDRSGGQSSLDPPVEERGYKVVAHSDGELGDNPFFVVDFFMLPDNPREQLEVDNGTIAGAEAFELQGMFSRRGLMLMSLAEDDVDYFKIEALEFESIAAVCEGESGGSGVRGLVVELRDGADQVLATATETSTANLELKPIMVPSPGTYYLRMSTSTPAATADSADPWARCAMIVSL